MTALVDEQEVTLLCPISRTRIKNAVRGNQCLPHVNAFDMNNFLALFADSKVQPVCPICRQPIQVPYVYFMFILFYFMFMFIILYYIISYYIISY